MKTALFQFCGHCCAFQICSHTEGNTLTTSASFNCMPAFTNCSDFGNQENTVCHCFHCFCIYLPWSNGGFSNAESYSSFFTLLSPSLRGCVSHPAYNSSKYILSSGIAGSCDNSIFNFLRNCITVFNSSYILVHSHQKYSSI